MGRMFDEDFMKGASSSFQETRQTVREIRQDDLNRLRQILWITFGILVILSFGGGYLIAGRMLSPLQKINKTIKKINAQNLHTKIKHPNVDDEIGELIGNFNKMIARLNRSFGLQKQFVENASHELKTPLAIAQTNLDSALSKKKVSKKELESSAETTLQSIKFMNKLIEDLLLLSLSEEDIKFKKVNIVTILKNSVKHLDSLAERNKVKIVLDLNSKLKQKNIRANQNLLQRVFMNLIENAIKYSKKGGKIEVSLKQVSEKLVVRVEDDGVGIPKDKIDKVFERFYRVNKSRSRKSGGTGLGLAIVKRVIELHGGEVSIKSIKGEGTKFKMEL